MSSYAKGKRAFGFCDRTGFRYPLNRMKKEWTGALVGFDEWEPKQPQLEPRRKVVDPQALRNPRPDRVEPLDVPVGGGGFPDRGIDTQMIGSVGRVTVVTT